MADDRHASDWEQLDQLCSNLSDRPVLYHVSPSSVPPMIYARYLRPEPTLDVEAAAKELRTFRRELVAQLDIAFSDAVRARDSFGANVIWLMIRERVQRRNERLYATLGTLLLRVLDTEHKLYSAYEGTFQVRTPDGGIREDKPSTIVLSVSERLAKAVAKDPHILHQVSPRGFEELIADVVASFGYRTELTARTRDGGRDIIAIGEHNDVRAKLLIECKRYGPDNPVGVELVRALFGVKVDEKATKALLATTSRFTRPARQFEDQHVWELELKDYAEVLEWIAQYRKNVGLD